MKINVDNKIKSVKGLLLVPISKNNLKKLPAMYPPAVKDFINSRVKAGDLKGKSGEMIDTFVNSKGLPQRLLILASGDTKKGGNRMMRNLGGRVGRYLERNKIVDLSVLASEELEAHAGAFLEGILMSQYRIDKLKTSNKKERKDYALENFNFISNSKSKNLLKNLLTAEEITLAASFVKDLVNNPSNMVDSEYMATTARNIAKKNGYRLNVLGTKELKKIKAGGILAVNQGSNKDAKLIVLQYDGAKDKKEKPIIIVGKGVIFDTGGYNLKPTKGIEEMHQDMAGGATVLGVFSMLKKMKVKKNVIGVIPVVENLISATAYRPSDIITMLSGNSVEITNTDAEGRIVLADAIHYATNFKPEAIITIATLTGAVGIALGDRYAGLMGNNVLLRKKLQKAGSEVDELAWPLPIHPDYKKKMDSRIADFTNYDMASGRFAGSSKGAAFLEKFVKGNKWCHIDIGGTAFTADPKDYQTKGATAHGFQLLLRFLERG